MFEISVGSKNQIQLIGRFDASRADYAKDFFNKLLSTTRVDFKKLDYISSAGLGILLMTQKRLKDNEFELVLVNMNNHIREIFKYAGFDMIFQIK